MKKKMCLLIQLVLILFAAQEFLLAQTTGKIVGRVIDAGTGEGLMAVNVMLEGTFLGAATDLNGNFYIINVSPGVYTLRVQMIGYNTVQLENLQVSVNRTSDVEIKMNSAIIEGEFVVVYAEKVTIKKDQTSSVRNVSSEQIDILPVENVSAIIEMQAGVVDGHFRGGRLTEVAYLIDGLPVTESFSGAGKTVDLEPETIQDLEVITGTFNAEYGNAMSGIVNAVTKDGGKVFHGSISANLANFLTSHKDIFIGLRDSELNRNQDYKFHLSGPIWSDRLSFFTNYRYQDNKNHLNGIRRFNVDDLSSFMADDPALWHSEHTGDSAYVPMNRSKNKSFMGKITSKMLKSIKMSLLYTYNDDEWYSYNHRFKYNPDGMAATYRKTDMLAFQLNHMISPKSFYELKLSNMKHYYGCYVYEEPFDSLYVHDKYLRDSGPGFYTGGQQKDHTKRTMKEQKAKFDLTWQIHKNHMLKTGFSYVHHDLDYHWSHIYNLYEGTRRENELYEPVIYPDSSIYSDIYRVKPFEFSAYFQNKMEFEEMVINVGVRYDYFDPNTVYPSQRRNPANQLSFPDNPSKMSTYLDSKPKVQVSPRFGLSYKLGKAALLRFSYGHFFQMPPMYAMYQNHSFQVAPNDYETTMGNSEINVQKTVQYEVGLWQEIMEGMGIEVALFYRDIYDLLSAKVISTFNQIEYGLYSNKDYGNAKGLEIKYDFAWRRVSAYLNYTLQYTRGNADNPTHTFTRAGNSMDPITRLIPMSWDQRHTLNLTLSYHEKNYNVTLTGYYNSGTPYTWTPIVESTLAHVNLYPNNNWQPSKYNVDLTGYYDIKLAGNMNLRFTLSVYNLLDRLNEEWVNDQTGRAYTAIIRETNLLSHRSDFNEYIDRIQNPSMYSAPRLVKMGISLTF